MHKNISSIKKLGIISGFLFSYYLFSMILFIIIRTLNKIPREWSASNIFMITAVLVGTSYLIQRWLK